MYKVFITCNFLLTAHLLKSVLGTVYAFSLGCFIVSENVLLSQLNCVSGTAECHF